MASQLDGARNVQQHALAAGALASVGVSLVAFAYLVRVVPTTVRLPANAPTAGLLAAAGFSLAAAAQGLVALRAGASRRAIALVVTVALVVTLAALAPFFSSGGVVRG